MTNKETNISKDAEIQDLSEQRLIRRKKLEDLRNAGRDPYIHETYDIDAYSKEIKDRFEEFDGKELSLSGRLMTKRVMGKASFAIFKIEMAGYKFMLGVMTSAKKIISGLRHTTSAILLELGEKYLRQRLEKFQSTLKRLISYANRFKFFLTSGADFKIQILDIDRDM